MTNFNHEPNRKYYELLAAQVEKEQVAIQERLDEKLLIQAIGQMASLALEGGDE